MLAWAAIAGCGGDDDDGSTSAAAGVTEVARQLLQSDTPSTAPGQDLQLTRVIIPAGMDIATHTHPGPQLATIAEGTLTFTVIRGQVHLTRQAGSGEARTSTVTAGQTIELDVGDAVLEPAGVVHSARNAGDVAVVIYLSSLFPTGAPASSPAQ
jgi:quercetin dioxygenase-like cupin family protein